MVFEWLDDFIKFSKICLSDVYSMEKGTNETKSTTNDISKMIVPTGFLKSQFFVTFFFVNSIFVLPFKNIVHVYAENDEEQNCQTDEHTKNRNR